MTCSFRRCKGHVELTYLGFALCWRHWLAVAAAPDGLGYCKDHAAKRRAG